MKKIKIGFTGTQKGMTEIQSKTLSTFIFTTLKGEAEFHHGDCIGADTDFHKIVTETYNKIIIHPPINSSKRSFCNGDIILECKEYLVRNHDIVDSTDVLFVAPSGMNEELRSGTWATYRYAMKKEKAIFIFFPNGKVESKNILLNIKKKLKSF